MHILQPAFAIAVGLFLALLADGALTMLYRRAGYARRTRVDVLLTGLAALAVFGIAAFAAYVLF